MGLPQADCSSSRSDPETNRLPHGDGPSTGRVACLRQRFSSNGLQTMLLSSCLGPGEPNRHSRMIHISESGLAGVLKGVVIPFQDPPLM